MKNFIFIFLLLLTLNAEARRSQYTGEWRYEGASKGLRHGCGSRGGPGWRKPNGRCASWREYEKMKVYLEGLKKK